MAADEIGSNGSVCVWVVEVMVCSAGDGVCVGGDGVCGGGGRGGGCNYPIYLPVCLSISPCMYALSNTHLSM